MRTETYHLEFLTPCFCAGANQGKAELRAPSIRGELRWWFRALGGTASEETQIFGGVHGDDAAASRIIVRSRAEDGTGEKDWYSKIRRQGEDRSAYLLGFFCGRTDRLNVGGALPPSSTGTISVTYRETPTELLNLASRAFFSLGGLGFRATRTGGSFATREHPLTNQSWNDLVADLEMAGFGVSLRPEQFGGWSQLIDHAGNLLKFQLRSKADGLGISAGRNGTTPNALGSAEPRQASGVHFRAVRIDHRLRLALLEPPHGRVLGEKATQAHRNRGPILKMAGFID